ncbi:Nem1-Spo7 phosphatase regulatory subunit [Coniosporium apollinis]|uniref:Nem1-Spo7 phosphatase regulatory subunit n=1 Tax=Coniosporium apollinis TaxID=61459 RepID=A0ABQ9NP55_9PEZI|nr:Nem1-Spo7 phosphatase regulatory subunit [Coniosporium apollinis]
MSESKLDQIVKGAPPPNITAPEVAAAASSPTSPAERTSSARAARSLRTSPRTTHPDPTSLLPSSPPQIYLNLLILEASLRAQYLQLRGRRRTHTCFFGTWILWTSYFGYALFLAPREDGSGVGGSVYWGVERLQRICFMGAILVAVLVWATGVWERHMRWPRRWLGTANRGLRGMNCKVVVIRGPWWKEWVGHLGSLIPYSLFFPSPGSEFRLVEVNREEKRALLEKGQGGGLTLGVPRHVVRDHVEYVEEDVAPGGDHVKLLLLPKPFTPDFRENWELYRTEYWEKENERRAGLRKKLRARDRELARQEGGWLWWTGWRGWKKARGLTTGGGDIERPASRSGVARHASVRNGKKRESMVFERERDGSHSRSSSRSSTPVGERDHGRQGSLSITERERRWSNSTAGSVTSDRKRNKPMPLSMARSGSSTRPSKLTPTGSRPVTPTTGSSEAVPALTKRSSALSILSTSSGDSDKASAVEDEKQSGEAIVSSAA